MENGKRKGRRERENGKAKKGNMKGEMGREMGNGNKKIGREKEKGKGKRESLLNCITFGIILNSK